VHTGQIGRQGRGAAARGDGCMPVARTPHARVAARRLCGVDRSGGRVGSLPRTQARWLRAVFHGFFV